MKIVNVKTVKKLLAVGTLASAAMWAPSAFPCGMPFGGGATVDPQQDIVVSYRDGIETYVFKPTFCGTAKDIAVVLPVPAPLSGPPTIVDKTVFGALADITAPRHVSVDRCYGDYHSDAGADGGGGGVGGGTTIVSSGTVGFVDWSQVKADSDTALTAWLDSNGYSYTTSPALTAAFKSYVARGWYFIAFKVSRGATGTCDTFGPLALEFPAKVPVVPTRIATAAASTVGSRPFLWRIYGVSGDGSKALKTAAFFASVRLDYEGGVTAADASKLPGIALAGDRLSQTTIGFSSFGAPADDLELPATTSAVDFRTTITSEHYVDCDAGPGKTDGGPTVPTSDGALPSESDANPADDTGASAATDTAAKGGGCSVGGETTVSTSFVVLAGVVVMSMRRRRRQG